MNTQKAYAESHGIAAEIHKVGDGFVWLVAVRPDGRAVVLDSEGGVGLYVAGENPVEDCADPFGYWEADPDTDAAAELFVRVFYDE